MAQLSLGNQKYCIIHLIPFLYKGKLHKCLLYFLVTFYQNNRLEREVMSQPFIFFWGEGSSLAFLVVFNIKVIIILQVALVFEVIFFCYVVFFQAVLISWGPSLWIAASYGRVQRGYYSLQTYPTFYQSKSLVLGNQIHNMNIILQLNSARLIQGLVEVANTFEKRKGG